MQMTAALRVIRLPQSWQLSLQYGLKNSLALCFYLYLYFVTVLQNLN